MLIRKYLFLRAFGFRCGKSVFFINVQFIRPSASRYVLSSEACTNNATSFRVHGILDVMFSSLEKLDTTLQRCSSDDIVRKKLADFIEKIYTSSLLSLSITICLCSRFLFFIIGSINIVERFLSYATSLVPLLDLAFCACCIL